MSRTTSTSVESVQRHEKVLFEFLSEGDDPISAAGTVIVREGEMYLEVDCPRDRPYSIRGRACHGFWHGHHKGLHDDVPVEAKWAKLDDIFIGV